MEQFSQTPAVALAIYAHPDDADVAAGGLLAAWADAGAAVHLVVVCAGDKGSHLGVEAGDLPTTRQGEAESAGAELGLTSVRSLARPDGEVQNDLELRESLVSLIRTLRPDVVVGPDPTAVFFGGVYVNHRDHRETGWALLDAVAPAAAMPGYFPTSGPAHQVSTLLLSGTHEPDAVVDISTTIEKKIRAVMAHTSQVGSEARDIAEAVRTRASQAGRPVGVPFGEAFRRVEFGQ